MTTGRGSIGTEARAPSPSPREDHRLQTLYVIEVGDFGWISHLSFWLVSSFVFFGWLVFHSGF